MNESYQNEKEEELVCVGIEIQLKTLTKLPTKQNVLCPLLITAEKKD